MGESEKTVAEIFRVAKRASPSVIFFDEIEALFSNRDSAGTFGKNVSKMRSENIFEMVSY